MAAATDSTNTSVEEITNTFQRTSLDSYLFLPDNPFRIITSPETYYVVYLSPMNSSGDIYHIVTYLLLSRFQKQKLPFVLLSYDGNETQEYHESKMNTYSQALRCIKFAKHFGFEAQFNSVDLGDGSYRQNARNAKMLKYLQHNYDEIPQLLKLKHDHHMNICFIEQKLLTTLISYYFTTNGRKRTTKILYDLYMTWSVNEDIDKKIKQAVQYEINEIKNRPKSKSLIIFQYRYSSKANSNQNISEMEILRRLEQYLKLKGYDIWYLCTDSRSGEPAILRKITNKTHCFPFEIDNEDYGKLFHLEFLLQLLNIENLKGIIGNTSGCLDLAAFIGHNVLNLHQFFGDKNNYQSYRIFLQCSFLVIEDFNENVIQNELRDNYGRFVDFNDETMETMMPILFEWINLTQSSRTFPLNQLKYIKDTVVTKAGFVDLHRIITKKDDILVRRSIPIFKQLQTKLYNNNS